MQKNKKKLKLLYICLGVCLVLVLFMSTYGQYVYLELKDYYLASKNFYFNSDKLTPIRTTYQVENWSGVDNYNISINLNSFKNNFEVCDSDITYEITYTCSNNVNCTLSKESGTIYASSSNGNVTNNTDNIVATIAPAVKLNEGDSAFIEVVAKSTSPYTKTISAYFILNVSIIGLSYEIIDEAHQPYLNFDITNTLDYYTIVTAFDSYNVGDKIDINTYLALSDANKAKCKSALVTLKFDPNVVVLDMTSPSYLKATNYTTQKINNYDYINSITFNVDAISSEFVKFYKVDATKDYTYPFVNNESIIKFSYS